MASNGVLKRKYSGDDVDPNPKHVKLSIRFQDQSKLHFKVKEDTEMSKVFKDFCVRSHLEYETIQFIYDGVQLNGKNAKKTPKMLNIEDGAELLAVRHQVGGGIEGDDDVDSTHSILKY